MQGAVNCRMEGVRPWNCHNLLYQLITSIIALTTVTASACKLSGTRHMLTQTLPYQHVLRNQWLVRKISGHLASYIQPLGKSKQKSWLEKISN